MDKTTQISPSEPFITTFAAEGRKEEEVCAEVRDKEGQILLSYQADKPEIRPVPDPAKAAKDPQNIASVEQRFLTLPASYAGDVLKKHTEKTLI